jgi:hypothetical protein
MRKLLLILILSLLTTVLFAQYPFTVSTLYAIDSIQIGQLTPNETLPTFAIRADADSDAADVTEILTLSLTANADPTLAVWNFISTQSNGYGFDKHVALGTSATIGTSGTIIDGSDSLVDADAIYDYVNARIKFLKVSLTTEQVATLGTVAVELLPALAAGEAYQILGLTWSLTKTTRLEVASQTLIITAAATSDPIFSISNVYVESNSSVILQPSVENEGTVEAATAVDMWLSGSANPSSGDCTMDVYITYVEITL